MEPDLTVDPGRSDLGNTGIFVRARMGEKWVNADISELDVASLTRWLRSRGGHNPWAESVVLMLLGHKTEEGAAG